MSHNITINRATKNSILDIIEVLSPEKNNPIYCNDAETCKYMAEAMLTDSITFINYLGKLPVGVIELTNAIQIDDEKIASAIIYTKKGFEKYKSNIIDNLEWQALTHNFNVVSLITGSLKDEELLKAKGYKENKEHTILDDLQAGREKELKEYTKKVLGF